MTFSMGRQNRSRSLILRKKETKARKSYAPAAAAESSGKKREKSNVANAVLGREITGFVGPEKSGRVDRLSVCG